MKTLKCFVSFLFSDPTGKVDSDGAPIVS